MPRGKPSKSPSGSNEAHSAARRPAKPLLSGARAKIRRLVVERMSPGDRLPSEQELAARFTVSRNTVREALKELETLGMVRRRWGHGTFVSPNIGFLQKWLN